MPLLVYAVASAGRRASGTGVAGERLRHVRVRRLDAIVGHVAKTPAPSTRNLQQYDRVMTRLWRSRAAILPVRFATVVSDSSQLELVLRDRQDALRRQLKVVRGRAQMTVRILEGQGAVMARASSGSRGGPDKVRPTGTDYLRALAKAQEIPAFAPLRAAVRRWVREERVERLGTVATVYHLVPNGAAARYRAALTRAADAAGVRVLVSGPWPPYAFAENW
jgi:hypothetical protein